MRRYWILGAVGGLLLYFGCATGAVDDPGGSSGDDSCTEAEYNSGALDCDGDRVVQCKQDGSAYSWQTNVDCGDQGMQCSGGQCVGGGGGSTGGTGGTGGQGGSANTECFDECDVLYPAGYDPWMAMMGCLACGACFDICTAEIPDLAASGEEAGCSASSMDCNDCINGDCSTTECGAALDACANTPDCISLNDCYADC